MLTLTDSAVGAIRDLRSQRPDLPEGMTLRIQPRAGDAGELSLALASQPDPGDQVIESQDVKLFVEEQAAAVLDDKVLDAQVDDQGKVSFLIDQQAS